MKRITSLDFARGIAVFGMTIFHAFFVSWEFFGTGDLSTLTWEYPFAFIFFIFGHWRGFFIMISAVVHFYAMGRSYKNGTEPYKILIKQIIFAAILWGLGALYNAFLNPWGILDTLFRTGTINLSVARSFVYFSEVLQNIAVGIFFASIIFFFFTRKNNMQKVLRNVLILGITAFVIIITSSGIQKGFSLVLDGTGSIDITQFNPSDPTDVHPFLQYIIIQIAGRESPIFPMLSSSFVGMIIGYLLIQDKPPKQMFKVGYWTSLGLFLFGGAWFGLVDIIALGKPIFEVLVFSHVHPTWFAFANTGLELAALLFLLQRVEFNPKLKAEKWLKRSRWFRRWGTIALTVYMFQSLIFLPAWILSKIPGTPDFKAYYPATFLWSLLLAVIIYLLWEGLIRLWELGRFIGTPEWFLVYANMLTSGRKVDHLDPLRSRGIIYDVEPVMFVEPIEQKPEEKSEAELST
ncbi:MAG: hypothetical protein FK731_02850 [Asgard group archaeon]|nr:hypothetical protein [Asgard group archaeon]